MNYENAPFYRRFSMNFVSICRPTSIRWRDSGLHRNDIPAAIVVVPVLCISLQSNRRMLSVAGQLCILPRDPMPTCDISELDPFHFVSSEIETQC